MNTSKKFTNNKINEGESPEENSILDDLQSLVNLWKRDNNGNIKPIVSLQQLIDGYYSKPLQEIVGGDEEWHTKEQGEFFTLDGSENLGNTDYFKEFCALNSDKKIAVSLTLPIDYLRRIAPFSTPYGLVLITGNQKALCLTDLEKLWNNQLNKRNLTVHKSKLAQNYARNYKPSKVLLERFHEQQNSYPYISAPNKLKPHKIKEGVSDKH